MILGLRSTIYPVADLAAAFEPAAAAQALQIRRPVVISAFPGVIVHEENKVRHGAL